MTAPEPLDPAKVMTAHRPNVSGKCRGCPGGYAVHPCPPYRLAEVTAERDRLAAENAALRGREVHLTAVLADAGEEGLRDEAIIAALREQVQRVKAEIRPLGVVYAALPDTPATHRLKRILNRLRAVLAGEGAADQPQGEFEVHPTWHEPTDPQTWVEGPKR